jgi:hypothetical protein
MIPRFSHRIEFTPFEIRIFFALIFMLLVSGCTFVEVFPPPPTSTSVITRPTITAAIPVIVATAIPPTSALPSPTPYPWVDANTVMSGLCYESVADAAGQTFVIRSAEALTRFYDLADNSELCRHPVERAVVDFSNGGVLVGLWSKAVGCKALHEVIGVQRDDVAHTYVVRLRLLVEPGCSYELVRPFWIGLTGMADYDVRLLLEET